jgi:glutathione S-transferase
MMAREGELILYELAGADAEVRISPYCWKTRLALAHKGVEATRLPWRFTEKEVIAFPGQGCVPVLVHASRTICDS